ncbi:hypothetical protein PHYSODRAFT_499446 [Phytophthora sojae]|uniref:Vacuolar protein 8 n=1 Tax=Phytophthora sojae (strain P6497) TaxID=1094619 RepID=G4ZD51_PHYSP|nr:hypothetical protein PHYSODRAFT_499446 [Phytophthora sojae]EGZ16459.1 hypothetical protein PHYSODRAFT_499446 [Phytophthora sojae]|eukprot:XP_009525517.1 hypothetical protein PHYSODRAFT_499446 [Phytophthora sojae]
MGVLDLVAEVSAGRETEVALRCLLRASINDEQRALMYKINGVQRLITLLKGDLSYFAQLYVLQCLKWSMVADSMLTTPEFEEIRKSVREASKSELALVVADLKTGSDQEKEKAVALCGCIATRGDTDSLFEVGVVQPLVTLLRGNDEQKLWAAEALGNLTTGSDAIRAQIMQGEAIPSLVALVLVGTEDQKHRAAYALGNLALSKDANELIVRRGVIGPLVGLVHTGSIEQRDSAACALMTIANTNDALRADIERDGDVSLFVALLRAGSDEEKNYAACKLRDLAVKDVARVQIVRGGGIALLVVLVESGTKEQKQSADPGRILPTISMRVGLNLVRPQGQ